MGITFASIERMEKLGLFGKGKVSVLDIGSSNLYSASPEQVEGFIQKFASTGIQDIKSFAQRLAKGSGYDPVRGGLNESFVGELFEKAGMEYRAFDIADGYRTQILDLNHAVLPKDLLSHFDLVLNFGTTEHILNQYNCFKVIHDATKLGGYIHHSLPGTGYGDHGYITYTCRCFFDIAGYNEYEIVDFWFDGPGGRNDMLQGLRSYSGYFPALKRVLEEIEKSQQSTTLRESAPSDIGINIVCRKVKNKPFWGALESSTSVGVIPNAVTASYAGHGEFGGSIAESNSVANPASNKSSVAHRISHSLKPYPQLHAIAKRVYNFLPAKTPENPPASAQVEADPGLTLTEEQGALRDKLLNGALEFDEALAFYSAMVAAHGSFPHEWEEQVLRLGIAKHPDRAEFADRLEVVLSILGKTPITARNERATRDADGEVPVHSTALTDKIAAFGARALVGLTDPVQVSVEFSEAVGEAKAILSNVEFASLPVMAQIEAIVSIHDTAMSVVLRESLELADLMSAHFVRLLQDKNLAMAQAMRLYDCLYGLYFAGSQSVREMCRFDSNCVLPFDQYLQSEYGNARKLQPVTDPEKMASICYFCHCAHFEKGNAVSPIIATLAKSHARDKNRKIYLYCVQWVNQDFVESFAGSGVVVRQFKQDWRYDQLDTISSQLAVDAIDVVITDLNSSIASALFAKRSVPLQMWIVMAFPYWSLSSLDWTMLPVLDYQPDYGIAHDKVSALKIKQEPGTLFQGYDENALQRAQSALPENCFIFAVFSRLIKVPSAFLQVALRILHEEPRAHFLIVGTGDPRTLYDLAGELILAKRITFIHGNVDLNVYGRVVDVMLDTFPFHGGNACREVAIHGKPVLSLHEAEWGLLLDDERDTALLARDTNEYVALALRLARDSDFYAARSIEARNVALRVTQTGDMVAEVELAIERARTHRKSAVEKSQPVESGRNFLSPSKLDQLIARNVAGKNGHTPFYPGQADPMAAQFTQFANEMFGTEATEIVANAESLLLAYLLNLYRQSGESSVRHLQIDIEVRKKINEIYQANQSVASPLYIATRYLIAEMYSRVTIEEPALELGMGFGDTAKAILGARKLAVGSTPIVDEIMGARHHFGNHRCYVAADAAQIPYADDTFNSIVMNYAFYHLEDPARTCQEMLRVLAPGGRIYFNFAIRDHIEPTRVWPRLVNELGLPDYGKMASNFVFTDYGGADNIPTKTGCLTLLERYGFTDIESIDYLSTDLSRLIWLIRDLEILFQLNLHKANGNPTVESAYRQFVENQMAALLSNDSTLCKSHGGGTYMFVSARKPGLSPQRYNDEEIADRITCPITREPLQKHRGYLWSDKAKVAYPIYREIPLIMPIYAELWKRQNAKMGSDPATWAPFSY